MNRVAFGKISRYALKAAVLARPETARDDSTRTFLWAAAGVLTGFLAAAIECL